MALAGIIFASVHLLLTVALTIVYIRNERKNKFIWRRLTPCGRVRKYFLAVFLANFAILIALAVLIFSIILPPAPRGLMSKVQNFVRRTDERLTPS